MMPKIASVVVCALVPGVAVGANLRPAAAGRPNNAAIDEQGITVARPTRHVEVGTSGPDKHGSVS